jgi:hypothetical protein
MTSASQSLILEKKFHHQLSHSVDVILRMLWFSFGELKTSNALNGSKSTMIQIQNDIV